MTTTTVAKTSFTCSISYSQEKINHTFTFVYINTIFIGNYLPLHKVVSVLPVKMGWTSSLPGNACCGFVPM